MKEKILSAMESPLLVGVVTEKTPEAAIAEIQNCTYNGAQMIDLHLSCLEDTDDARLKRLFDLSRLPVLAVNYDLTYERQPRNYTEEQRTGMLLKAVELGAAGVDIQGYTFHLPSKTEFCGEDKYSFTKNNPKEVVTDPVIIDKQKAFIEEVHAKGGEVLLSCHPDIPMNSTQVVELALFLEERHPDIIKVVTIATNEEELIESFKAMSLLKKEVKTKVSYHVGGPMGSLSRIVNPALGGHMIFCVDRFNAGSTMFQLDLKTAKNIVDNIKKIK